MAIFLSGPIRITALSRHRLISRVTPFSVVLFLALLSFPSCAADAQSQLLGTSWEKQFTQSINWFVRTSAGVLLVRAGKSLSAIDGVEGRQLWSIPDFGIAGGDAPGKNLLEIPGFSIVLANRATLPGQDSGRLLAIDLWSGAIHWQQSETDDLLQIIPFYDSGRVLLITTKTDKPLNALNIVRQAAASYYVGGPYPFRPQMILLDPLTGRADWKAEYPRVFLPRFLDFREWHGQLYLHECLDIGGFVLGRVDLKNGDRLWEFTRDELVSYGAPPALQFADEHVIFAAKDVFAFGPDSKAPVWSVRHLGKIRQLVLHQNLILGAGAGGAFAIESRTGALRWKIKSSGAATDPVLYQPENALVFFDKMRLFIVDVETGKILRRTVHRFGSEPRFIRSMGGKFVLAVGDDNAVLYDVATGEYLTALPKPTAEFPSVNFMVKRHSPDFGAPNAPGDLRRQLQDGWDKISSAGEKSQANQIGITRLKSFLAVDSTTVYGKKFAGDSWKLWCVNPTTGAVQQFAATGSQADASSALGLAYLVRGARLQAVTLPPDCGQIPPPTNGSAGR
jgi:outer membrane protein assembly factor BamB